MSRASDSREPNRREFLVETLAASVVSAGAMSSGHAGQKKAQKKPDAPPVPPSFVVVDDFRRSDSLYHGDGWETLNPGYWKIAENALRRRLHNVGDRARKTGFPYHYETHQNKPMPVEYDPSLPFGMIWRRDWKLAGNYTIRIEAKLRWGRPEPREGDKPDWNMYQPGYAMMGVCFGGQTQFESWKGGGKPGNACWMAAWRDNKSFGLYDHSTDAPQPVGRHPDKPGCDRPAPDLQPGDTVTIDVAVTGDDPQTATVTATLTSEKSTVTVKQDGVDRMSFTNGYFGVVARGLVDFEINRVLLNPGGNRPLNAPVNDLHVAYPLGDTLQQINGTWQCRFLALFRNGGKQTEIRISDAEQPSGGWQRVPVAGRGAIINNDFRRNTAIVDCELPFNPAEKTMFYTVWKDGRDVTADVRLGTDAVGPGTGLVGAAPTDGRYVGRLPRLAAPYRLCGLSCHAISGGNPNLPGGGRFQGFYVHDQPTPDAYRHLEEYDFQVMVWEDDVWYMELLIYPPSTDDAYKIVTTTIAGPTSRWQFMRHWNVLNPGDHDHGMDDVKGPEQIILRQHADLGQDPTYLQRNFQIVSHLSRGAAEPSPTDNPRRWRRWKMPGGDFTLLLIDSRLWRSSQDTHIWDDQGWGHKENLYDRTDPTRSLLGEEQFAWLQEIIRTDSSPLICLTGINGLHTIWAGKYWGEDAERLGFHQRDRVAADYAGWVKAGVDRVLDLLGGREGVVSVYGDVHNGSMLRNRHHRIYECSFGPIGRTGGRAVIPGFGPQMTDFDGREIDVLALYHQKFETPLLKETTGPTYWNFLEMHFDPREADPVIVCRLRNLIDPPSAAPRGGGLVDDRASNTGRPHTSRLPELKTLPAADVRFAMRDGRPIRGTRSLPDGTVPLAGLIDVPPGTQIVMTAHAGDQVEARIVITTG